MAAKLTFSNFGAFCSLLIHI